MTRWLQRQGHGVNRKRVRRLMAATGIEAIYRRPNLPKAASAHPVYPYLLRNLAVVRPNQVWAADITYIPVQGGYAYLCAVIDWHSRCVLGWELSNTLDASFCVRTVARAMAAHGKAGDLQHRPRLPVYQRGIYPAASGRRCETVDGRQRPVPGQRLRRTALAQPQVRRGLPSNATSRSPMRTARSAHTCASTTNVVLTRRTDAIHLPKSTANSQTQQAA
jgi:putative transposase